MSEVMKNHLQIQINSMKKSLEELESFRASNTNLPEIALAAIRNYRGELNSAITDMENEIKNENE
ncbi:MAG: hypothetical protein JWM44_1180 [Bacilli bacterium]|nr:hypothetical protein [Bacilli bacterium]